MADLLLIIHGVDGGNAVGWDLLARRGRCSGVDGIMPSLEYRLVGGCKVVERVLEELGLNREEYVYICSGDLSHPADVLQGYGFKSPRDLKPLVERAKSKYGDKIKIVDLYTVDSIKR